MWVIQIGMIDTGSSTCSLSVLLSAVEMSLRTLTGLEIIQWATCICAPHILATATIWGRHLFRSQLPIVWLQEWQLQRWHLIKEMCVHTMVALSGSIWQTGEGPTCRVSPYMMNQTPFGGVWGEGTVSECKSHTSAYVLTAILKRSFIRVWWRGVNTDMLLSKILSCSYTKKKS